MANIAHRAHCESRASLFSFKLRRSARLGVIRLVQPLSRESALLIWYAICYVLFIAAYSLHWFGTRRQRELLKDQLVLVPRQPIARDQTCTYMRYAAYVCAGLGAVVLLLLLLRVI